MTLNHIVKNGTTMRPPRIFLYGGAGSGKSTVASQARNPIFLPTEDGLGQIKCDSFPLIKTFDQMKAAISELKSEKHDYKTVVIDTVDWLEKIIWADLCSQYGVSDINSIGKGYGKGYALALGKWEELRLGLQDLYTKGMSIVFISHTQTTQIITPESETPVLQYTPKIQIKAKDLICEWCDAILFITRQFGSIKGEQAGGEMVFRTKSTPQFYAKSRYNLPEMIPLNWKELERCIAADWQQRTNNNERQEVTND